MESSGRRSVRVYSALLLAMRHRADQLASVGFLVANQTISVPYQFSVCLVNEILGSTDSSGTMFRMDPPLVRCLCALLDGSVYLRRVRSFTAGVTVVEALAIFLMVVGHGATFAFLRASGFKRSTETLWRSVDQVRHALLEEQTQRRQVDNAWQQGKIPNPWGAWIIVCR